ncbi:MAG: hypothetical protein ABIR18_14185 [Chitinophagaceae bacterium]
MTDNELINSCRKEIEEKLHLPGNGSWKQRDFQYLSDLIFERTGTRLSISTLKRIWKEEGTRVPQLYTLNALVNLLDYNSWNEYKKEKFPLSIVEPEQTDNKQFLNEGRYSPIIVLVLLIITVVIIYFVTTQKTLHTETITFRSRKNIATGVPNTVVFEYDISKSGVDSAILQQSWDTRIRAKVSKDNHYQTFIYYYPGYHTAKLIIDDKIIRQEQVNILTDGWEALVDGDVTDRNPFYLPKKEIISNGSLYASKDLLIKNNIRADDKEFFVNFFNVGNLGDVQAENFTLETRLKNNLAEGALVCQYTQVTLICENGMISVPFCNPGCASNIHLHISEIVRDGKKNDLAAFGTDLSDWRNIKIESAKKAVTVFIDNKPVYNLQFNKELGKITGLHFKFLGCGSVDKIRLLNEKKELSYEEEF